MDEVDDESVADNELTEETKKGKHSQVAKLVEQPGEPAKEVSSGSDNLLLCEEKMIVLYADFSLICSSRCRVLTEVLFLTACIG